MLISLEMETTGQKGLGIRREKLAEPWKGKGTNPRLVICLFVAMMVGLVYNGSKSSAKAQKSQVAATTAIQSP